RVRKLPETTL
nr:Chain C, Ribosomal protein S6 kinase alpha-1 [Homo sapiens]7PC8_D Chain D, Ribosomal protein S6 kinase alpha-1 [Homo sapiens]